MMQITIAIDENLLRAAAETAVRSVFQPETDRNYGGEGAKALKRQVEGWAKAQDFHTMIEEIARPMLAELLGPTVRTTLEAHIKRVLRNMKDSGKIDELVQTTLLEQQP
jgi:hypothetical protein